MDTYHFKVSNQLHKLRRKLLVTVIFFSTKYIPYMKNLIIVLVIIICVIGIYFLTQNKNKENFDGTGDNPRICPNDQVDEEVNKYVIENVLNNKQKELSNNSSKVSDQTLAQYRNQFFDFRNHLWGNSHLEDPVDKIVGLYLDGNRDISRTRRGEEIRDVFDEITGAHQHNQQCTTLPNEVFANNKV